jgi:acyl-CoA reductase-like NAD-dependent aldehyde dehydrogenase
MTQIAAERDRLLHDAFDLLEIHHGLLAQMLIQQTGGRDAAARWMYAHRKAFEGFTAYDLIAEGDIDRVWESIVTQPERQ